LWSPYGSDAHDWAKERLASTLAAALSDAVQAICPDFDVESEATVDLVQEHAEKQAIWFVETSPGGGGIVEAVQRRLAARPRHFVALLDRAVRPSDFEVVDAALRAIVAAAAEDSPLAQEFAAYRSSTTNDERLVSLLAIRRELTRLEISASHPVIAAVAARILRFGSGHDTDVAIRELSRAWEAAEEHIGIELESSAFAFTQRRSSQYDALLATTSAVDVERRRIGAIFSTLWPRGWRARAEGLRAYSPYVSSPPSDRLALERFRAIVAPAIDGSLPNWRRDVDEHLRLRGIAVVEVLDKGQLANLIREVTVEPTDTGSLLLHPVVVGVDGSSEGLRATLVLDEGVSL
jgi:hypothetical protein